MSKENTFLKIFIVKWNIYVDKMQESKFMLLCWRQGLSFTYFTLSSELKILPTVRLMHVKFKSLFETKIFFTHMPIEVQLISVFLKVIKVYLCAWLFHKMKDVLKKLLTTFFYRAIDPLFPHGFMPKILSHSTADKSLHFAILVNIRNKSFNAFEHTVTQTLNFEAGV